MERFEIFLTYEDAIRLEQSKSEAAANDVTYKHMTDSEYAEVLLHKFLNPDESNDENV